MILAKKKAQQTRDCNFLHVVPVILEETETASNVLRRSANNRWFFFPYPLVLLKVVNEDKVVLGSSAVAPDACFHFSSLFGFAIRGIAYPKPIPVGRIEPLDLIHDGNCFELLIAAVILFDLNGAVGDWRLW